MPKWEVVGTDKSLMTEDRVLHPGKGRRYLEMKIQMKCPPKVPFCPGVLAFWLIFQKRGDRNRISGKCSWGGVVEKGKRKKKKAIKHFLIRQEACVLGCGWEGENLSSECWAKVQGHFWIHPNNLSRHLLAHGRSGIWGFGKDKRIRNSERKKKKKKKKNLPSFWEREDEKG